MVPIVKPKSRGVLFSPRSVSELSRFTKTVSIVGISPKFSLPSRRLCSSSSFKLTATLSTDNNNEITPVEASYSESDLAEPIIEISVPFKKVLCANRGEIAIRVFRAADELGLRSVAIYSKEDRMMPHRFNADESYLIGGPDSSPIDCYLDVEAIINLTKEVGADAIHPGYGFLSENPNLSRRCAEEGIAFIGPPPEVLEQLGDKLSARKAAESCGVKVIPGTDEPVTTAEEALEFAESVGYPVMLKAAFGGGGRGLRVVRTKYELKEAFSRATSEAKASFGDGRMFVEKLIENPRHIEIQILADHFGNVVHLYERDCSVQRRHQKVVEMAPSIGLPIATRHALFKDAIRLAKHVGYRNAGTVEFIVDSKNHHYFLEVNPRVQVEHTVTEELTGIDIVQKQIYIAGGAHLEDIGLSNQKSVKANGFSIQCRVTSEDPANGFKPDSGRLEAFRVPGGPGVRLDGSVTTGNVVGRYYDSLLCKVITWAPSFEKAVQKMRRSLNEFQVRGIKTNIPFLHKVLCHPDFMSGAVNTSFIEKNLRDLTNPNKIVVSGRRNQTTGILNYLADMVVNGPDHPGAIGPPPSKIVPEKLAVPEELKSEELTGWRDILVEKGPEEWAKAVRAHEGVLLTDTTWRDAHQSLLATRVRTHDIMKSAEATAHIMKALGSIEMWGGATFDVALRFLHECPWRRLEQLRELVPNIPFQMLFRGANAVGYTSYPDNVVKAFIREAKRTGIDIFRIFDSLNYIDNLKFGIDEVRKVDGVAEGTLCYTGDLSSKKPSVYNLDYYLDLARQLVDHGVHTLAVKDMAGVLKPKAAEILVSALRAEFPNIPLHIHTHDSAGTGVATQISAAEAGADIVDCCIDSMSGMTSQPSMGAIVGALHGTPLDTGLDLSQIINVDIFWEQTRSLYAPYESNLKSTCSDVYDHAMPGGQYTNLKFQAMSLGLGDQWRRIKRAYAEANLALGDIVKVTPSSKVVGDLAQFMVQNNLNQISLVEQAEELSFPKSVVEFLQGYLGQPPNGFPEPLRSRVLKGMPVIEGRPGQNLPEQNLTVLQANLAQRWGSDTITPRDAISAALYPKVFEDYKAWQQKYGDKIEKLPTRAFLVPLEEDEELTVTLAKGVDIAVEYKAVGELQPDGKREVFFESNGVPRVLDILDRKNTTEKTAIREKAQTHEVGSVGAPMSGDVIEIIAHAGDHVKAGDQLVIMSAMKMETAVCAPCSGQVQHVAVLKGDILDAGDLLVQINPAKNGTDNNSNKTAAPEKAVATETPGN
eukprot:g2948.t1